MPGVRGVLCHAGQWCLWGRPGRCRKAVAEQHIDEGVEDTVEGDEITDRCMFDLSLGR